MADRPVELLPLHDFLSQIQGWQTDRSGEQLERVRSSIARIADAYGASGVLVEVEIPPLAPLRVGVGTLRDEDASAEQLTRHALSLSGPTAGRAELIVDGQYAATDRLIDAIELSLSAVW